MISLIRYNWKGRYQYKCPCSPAIWYYNHKDKKCQWCGKSVKIRNRFVYNMLWLVGVSLKDWAKKQPHD